MSTLLQNAVAFLEAAGKTALTDVEVSALPVVAGAVAVLQKSPTLAGALAAKAYLLGNAPAALVSAETAFVQTELSAIAAGIQVLLAGVKTPAP